jgi:hypothetical protein
MTVRFWWPWVLGVIGVALVAALGINAYALLRDDGETTSQVAHVSPTAAPTLQATPDTSPPIDVELSRRCLEAYLGMDAFNYLVVAEARGLRSPSTPEEADKQLQQYVDALLFTHEHCLSGSVVPVQNPGADISTICIQARVDIRKLKRLEPELQSGATDDRLTLLEAFIEANCR